MTQLGDLSDDCLMEVLERLTPGQLFKVLRANKRLNRLVAIKMQVNPIVAIKLFESENDFTCSHINAISPNKTLVLNKTFIKCLQARRDDPWKKAILFNILSRFPSIKSIDFLNFETFTDLISVIRWCPQLECLKVGKIYAKKEEWERVLNRIGHKLVHFVKESQSFMWQDDAFPSDFWIMKTIAAKCPNIKRVDWQTNQTLTGDFIEAIKLLPTSCWIKFSCESIFNYAFSDVFDELSVSLLNISLLRQRTINRLSSLTINAIRGSNRGVEFAGLKKLDFNGLLQEDSIDCLMSCQFPALEEFKFNTTIRLNEHYDRLFQRMESLKKLTIFSSLSTRDLPQSAIRRLKKLETIVLNQVSKHSNQDEFFKLLERYIDEVESLKMLVVVMLYDKNELKKSFKEGIEKLRQSRVAVEFLCRKNYK